MNGYKLPGVELTDTTDIQTARPSSSQRIPCVIGTISPFKTILYEELIRSDEEPEVLSMFSTGIVKILNGGSQRGLNNIVENKDITVNKITGEVTWLTTSEARTVKSGVAGLNLFSNIDGFVNFNNTVSGLNATSGFAKVGLDKIGSADSGLVKETEYKFKLNGTEYTITTPDVTVVTVQMVASLMNTAITGEGFSASFQVNDIVVTNLTLGSASSAVLAAGDTADLFAGLSDWTDFGDSTSGANATSGHQELGLNIVGSDNSGLAENTVYYFKVNSKQYHIETSTGVISYNALIGFIAASVAPDNFECTLNSGDIRITNKSTGLTSLVVLASSLPVEAKNNQLKIELTSGIINGAVPGRLKATAIINAVTYTFGIADDVDAGDKTITLSGTNDNLNKLRIGTELTLESLPAVNIGGRYFISYTYNRSEEDYVYQEYTKSDDLKAQLGANVPENSAVMLGCLGFDYFNLPRIGFVPVRESNQNSDYVEALQKCKNRNVQTLGVLNSSGTVRNAVISHVNERNLPKNGKYRMYYTGPSILTPIGDIDTPNSIAATANTIKNEAVAFINATRGKVYYKDPATNEDTFTVVDGSFIGAAIGLYRDSFSYPSQNLLRYTIPGIELFAEDFEDYYSDDALIAAGEGSAFLVGLGANSSILVKDDLTTDNTSVEANNINIVTAKHYIAKDVAFNLDNVFIGSIVTNRPAYKLNIENFLHNLFASYMSAKIIEGIDKIEVTLPPKRRDTVKIKYAYYAIYSHKYIEGEYSISI